MLLCAATTCLADGRLLPRDNALGRVPSSKELLSKLPHKLWQNYGANYEEKTLKPTEQTEVTSSGLMLFTVRFIEWQDEVAQCIMLPHKAVNGL